MAMYSSGIVAAWHHERKHMTLAEYGEMLLDKVLAKNRFR